MKHISRHRLMSFATSQQELLSLPASTQSRLLRKAIPECDSMILVWSFITTATEQLELFFADADNLQLKVKMQPSILKYSIKLFRPMVFQVLK